ncbi:interleukin-17 receptor A-like [Anneissia japonica]|uniref:interleukin-17 receptor A-like n=1 Tax=Anneissia japonica TaxID=1529436 RepID=UPI001425A93F|nr:interleukin-17 receptor A-like [Anneissia japonica]
MEPRPTHQGQQCSTNNAVNCYITTRDVIVRESPPELETSVAPSGTLPGFATSVKPPGKSKAVIAAVVGSLVGLLAIVFVAWLVCRKPDGSEKNNSFIGTGNTVVDQGMTTKRVFVIHSFDHELHKEVVLKLCIFLTNVCKLDVHTALWSTTDIAVGVNEWMDRECEEADKVIILCSQGTLIKWRAQSRQIDIKIHEDNLGDLFSSFMRLQGLEIAKDPKKFIVAYMDYSSEDDIPQPLKFLQKYQLMDHVEQMYYILNDMEKHGACHDFSIPALQTWDSSMDAGVELKIAVDQMKKKIRSEPHWFFDFNDISTDVKLKIFTKQSQRDTRPNPNVSIICDADPSLIILPQTDFGDNENDYKYQMSALNSLKEIVSKPNESFQNHRNRDSGVDDVYDNSSGGDPATYDGIATNDSTSIRNPFHGLFRDPNEHSCV